MNLILIFFISIYFHQFQLIYSKATSRRSTSLIADNFSKRHQSSPLRGFSAPDYSDETLRQSPKIRDLSDFNNRDSRLGFIRKVYSILATQVLTTFFVTYLILNSESFSSMVLQNGDKLAPLSFLISLGGVLSLTISEKLRNSFPWNFLVLGIYTLAQSLIVGIFSTMYDIESVSLSMMYTLTIFLLITFYSFQPNPHFDLTVSSGMLLTALSVLLLASISTGVFGLPINQVFFASCFALVIGAYIIYDTQMIIGGKHHRKKFHRNEYILAALTLYQDIIGLSMEIVKILGESKRKRDKDNDERKR
jgi:protein lifeguard